MTITNIIKKFNPTVIQKSGEKMIQIRKKPNAREVAFIKENKQEIIDEILRQKAEREAAEAERERQREEERQRLIDSGEAKLALVYYGSYLLNAKIAYVVKMNEEEKSGYADWCRDFMHKLVRNVYEGADEGKSIRKAVDALGIEFGESDGILPSSESSIFYITKEQYKQIKSWIENEDKKAEAEKAAKAKEEEERKQTIFEKAKETGKKQILSRWADDCNDPREECSTDIVTVWAMPDGSTKTERQHTW